MSLESLPSSLRQPHSSLSVSVLPVHAPTSFSHSVNSPLSPSVTPSHSLPAQTFTNPSHHRLTSSLRTDSTDFTTGPFLLSISVFCFWFLRYSLWPPCEADADIIFLSCGFFFFFFSSFSSSFFSWPNLSRRRLNVYHTSAHGVAFANLGCRSETC